MIKIAPTTIHSGWCHRIIVCINSKYCSMSLCMELMYICSVFYHEVLLASMFTNFHNSEHLKYFIPQYSPLFQNKALNPTRVNPGLPSGLTRGEMGISNPGYKPPCGNQLMVTTLLLTPPYKIENLTRVKVQMLTPPPRTSPALRVQSKSNCPAP